MVGLAPLPNGQELLDAPWHGSISEQSISGRCLHVKPNANNQISLELAQEHISSWILRYCSDFSVSNMYWEGHSRESPSPQHYCPSCMADGVVCSAQATGHVRGYPSILLPRQWNVSLERFRPKVTKLLIQTPASPVSLTSVDWFLTTWLKLT